jgi:hypothetical protein
MDMATNAMGIEKSIKKFMAKRFGSENLKRKNDEDLAGCGLEVFMRMKKELFSLLGSGSPLPLHLISFYFLMVYLCKCNSKQ